MNKKDREALDKFVDEDTLSPEDTKRFAEMTDGERATFIAERFFEAGAKHGRAELDELTSILDLKKETIVEMQNEYETLQAHDEMLIATADKLKEENKKLRDALKLFAFPDGKLEHENVERVSRQVLKEVGEE